MTPEPRWNIDRAAVPIFFALVTAALVVAAFCGGPLSWDGAFQLFVTLDRQIPFMPIHRAVHAVLDEPVLVVSQFSDNFTILRAVFCICYVSVPGLALALSWIACRARRPSLFIWPALSISMAMLPGQFMFQTESYMAASFTWPVFLAGLVGAEPGLLPVLVLLEVMVWFTHPIAVALSACAALATVVSASRLSGRARFNRYAGAFLLAVMALSRVFHGFSPYEHEMMSLHQVTATFQWSVLGWPLASLVFTSAAALQCLRSSGMNRPADGERVRRRLPAGRGGARGGNVPDSLVTPSERLGGSDRLQVLGGAAFAGADGGLRPGRMAQQPGAIMDSQEARANCYRERLLCRALAPKRDVGQAENPVPGRPSPSRLRMRTTIIAKMDCRHPAQSLVHRSLLDSSARTHAAGPRARRCQLRHLQEESRSEHHMVQQSQRRRLVRPGSRRGAGWKRSPLIVIQPVTSM